MTDNITEFPKEEPLEFMMGVMKYCPVIIEGRKIPGLQAWKEGDKTFILVDDRIAISVPNESAYEVCYIVATALAVGAGYTHIHAKTKDRCFAPLCAEIEL